MITQTVLPRWRGFNLPSKERLERDESDFQLISELGFDFVRIPMSYHQWTEPGGPEPHRRGEAGGRRQDRQARREVRPPREPQLSRVGRAIAACRETLLTAGEPWSLWKSGEALEVFCQHWRAFAGRYAGIPSSRLSFNLVNEAPPPTDSLPRPQTLPLQAATRAEHEKVIRAAAGAIRAVDPDRLIIVDGMWYGRLYPSFELADPRRRPIDAGVHAHGPVALPRAMVARGRHGLSGTDVAWRDGGRPDILVQGDPGAPVRPLGRTRGHGSWRPLRRGRLLRTRLRTRFSCDGSKTSSTFSLHST